MRGRACAARVAAYRHRPASINIGNSLHRKPCNVNKRLEQASDECLVSPATQDLISCTLTSLTEPPAEHKSGTPRVVSPTEAACAVTTFAAWMCSVRDTGSAVPGADAW